MEKIRTQHKKVIISVFATSAALYFFLVLNLPGIKAELDILGWFGISWTVVASSIIIFYERWGWRIFNPAYDFSGKWHLSEKQYEVASDQTRTIAYTATGKMRIIQDVRRIAIVGGQTYKFDENTGQEILVADWWSMTCDLSDTADKLYCALDHKPSPERIGGAVRYGVEVFTVRDSDKRGRPIKMSSNVYHCVGSATPHLVEVNYERETKK